MSKIADNTIHKHHAVQVIIGMGNEFKLYYDDEWHAHETAIIAPDTPHRLLSPDSSVMLILIDHETEIAGKLSFKYLKDNHIKEFDSIFTQQELIGAISKKQFASCIGGKQILDNMLHLLLGPEKEKLQAVDQRIQKALDMIQGLSEKKISTLEIADYVCLSESRLLHLFKEQVGIPVRRYLLWLRLNEAVKQILNNMSLTDAAHEVGFSDSAHLSRTFRSMFGMTISEILKNRQFIRIIPCMD